MGVLVETDAAAPAESASIYHIPVSLPRRVMALAPCNQVGLVPVVHGRGCRAAGISRSFLDDTIALGAI